MRAVAPHSDAVTTLTTVTSSRSLPGQGIAEAVVVSEPAPGVPAWLIKRTLTVVPEPPPVGPWRNGARRVVAVTVYALPWALVAAAGAYGLLVRIWLLAHLALFGDEAVVGLMGRGILHGHLDAFFWGSNYAGGEAYVVAAVLGRINGGPMGVNGTPAGLALVAAVLTYAVLSNSRANRRVAALGAAMVWVWPYAAIWNSVREVGFRGATLCCGLVLVLCALRVYRRRAGIVTRVMMGLALGAGWWTSVEIVYFAIPSAILIVASWDRLYRSTLSRAGVEPPPEVRRSRWARPWHPFHVVLPVVGAAVGALPWTYANVRSGFASLSLDTRPPRHDDYLVRLSLFFHKVLPTQLGLRAVPGGAWVDGRGVGRTIYVIALVVLGLLLLRVVWGWRMGRKAAPLMAFGVAVVAFPFIYAFFPTSWYWVDGRYGVYLPPLLVLLAVWSLPSAIPPTLPRAVHAIRRPPRRRARVALAIAIVGVAAAAFSTLVVTHESVRMPTHPSAFFAGWSDPNKATRNVVTLMEAHHIRFAYGTYWTAYTLDFLAPNAVTASPTRLDDQRSAALAEEVAHAKSPAWLFFAPGQRAADEAAFANPERGPGNWSEKDFTNFLTGSRIGYRVVHLGLLDAVLPAHRVHLPK